MRCELMHKDIPVAEINIDESDGAISELRGVRDMDHLPVGSVVERDVRCDRLRRWWSNRSIPVTRSGIAHLMRALDLDSTGPLLSRSMGLSLSDHYWIRPSDTNVSWDEVNFFDNGFSDDLGDLLFGKDVWVGEMDFRSPDSTSDGMLRKRWKIIDGRRCLIKSGTSPYMQEPFNEVIASRLAERLGIPAVEYSVTEYEGTPCSMCEDFVTRDTELVSAQQVMRSEVHDPGISAYDHFVSCCSHHGIDIAPFLDRMLTLDYIIVNGDRHFNNFGILHDPDSLEWLGPAPIYDSGSSLGLDLEPEDIVNHAARPGMPFAERPHIQMDYVRDLSWVDVDALCSGIIEAGELLGSVERYREKGRDQAILDLMDSRADEVYVSLRDHFGDISSARMTTLLLQHSKSGSMSLV